MNYVLMICDSLNPFIWSSSDTWANCQSGWEIVEVDYVPPEGGVNGEVVFTSGLDTATFEAAIQAILVSMAIAGAFMMIRKAMR